MSPERIASRARERARRLRRRAVPLLKGAACAVGVAALVFTFAHLRAVFPAVGAVLRLALHPVAIVLLVAGLVLLRLRGRADRETH